MIVGSGHLNRLLNGELKRMINKSFLMVEQLFRIS
jgi:hypothetical protein